MNAPRGSSRGGAKAQSPKTRCALEEKNAMRTLPIRRDPERTPPFSLLRLCARSESESNRGDLRKLD